MPKQGYKTRLNLTIDPEIYRAAKARFAIADMNMSGFVEDQLVLFLQLTEPLVPLFEAVERGDVQPDLRQAAARNLARRSSTLQLDPVKFAAVKRTTTTYKK